MRIRKLVTGSCLGLSIVVSGFFGVVDSPANACDCIGSNCADIPNCAQASSQLARKVRIRYTIANTSSQAVRFRLPSGRIYQLGPGEGGMYYNSGYPNALMVHVFNSGHTYRLSNGAFKFWESGNGWVGFSRR